MPSNRCLYVDPYPMPTNECLTSTESRKYGILTTSNTQTQNVTPVISSWASFFHGAQSTCFFDFCKGTFIHYDFETKEQIGFDRNDFQNIEGEMVWSNLIIVSTNSTDTKFLAAIREEATGKLYIVLFNANFSQHKISVVSEMWSNFESKNDYRFYLYKSGNGLIFMIAFCRNDVRKITRYCVRKVCVTEMGLVFGRASSSKYPGLWFLPFVEDDILYFLPAKKKNKILKIPLNGGCNTEILINCDDNKISTLGEAVGSPLNFGGRIVFCWVTGDKKVSVLWSLQLEKLLLKCEGHFPADEFSLLQYAIAAPDGSVFVVAERKILHVALPPYWIKNCIIDRGGYGVVMTAAYATHGNVAVKILMNENFDAVSEAQRIKKLNNPFIVTAFGYIAEEFRFLLFMELMEQSVRNKILCTAEKRLKEKEALGILQQALNGLVYLHLLKPRAIVHRDIKCDNLLIDKEGNVKLADFGLAKDITLNSNASSDARHSSNKIVGTPYFKAPEILVSNSNSCSRKVDVWSIGCALAEMLTGLPPYADIHIDTHSWAILAYNEKLTYKPKEFLPLEIVATAKMSLKILKKTFIRQTKKKSGQQLSSHFVQGNTGERIRPHSWELLEEFWK